MSICQVMIGNFMGDAGTPRYDERGRELYDNEDLRFGREYAQLLLAEGEMKEPFHGYDLLEFVGWCNRQLFPDCYDCRIKAACVHQTLVLPAK